MLREGFRIVARVGRAAPRSPLPFEPVQKRLGALGSGAVVFAVLAAGPGFALGDLAGLATSGESRPALGQTAPPRLMPFERAGTNFPGSAFYYLADPPRRAALIALPETDPLAAEGPRSPGEALDPGPAAAPFLAASGNPRAEQCLAEAVFYEAASESEAGQRAVAQVVLNRVRHPAWPNSVCAVVFEGAERATGCQFTFTCDGSRARPAAGAGWERARRIARMALAGEVYAPVGLATHYHTLWVAPRWAGGLDHVGTIGAHRFYRARGRAGSLAAFDTAYAGVEPGLADPGAGSARGKPAGAPPARAGGAAAPLASPAPDAEAGPSLSGEIALRPGNAPVSPSEPAAAPAAGSGSVREEYRAAGRWKTRPESADSAARKAPRIAVEALDE